MSSGFYKVHSTSLENTNGTTKVFADIWIDPSHPIFEGHFPGQPVLPGVCMMQIVRELMTSVAGSSLMLTEASSVKFLAVLDPSVHGHVNVEISISKKENNYRSTSRIYLENLTFFKMEAVFQATLFKLPGSLS